ncbi:conserved hypothetical protein, partial [Trichinella spiralis]
MYRLAELEGAALYPRIR